MRQHEPGEEVESQGSPLPDRTILERGTLAILELVGFSGVILLMLLTVSDGLLRTFANRPILGADDYTQVILALVVAVSLPLCVASGRAIAVDLFVRLMPLAVRRSIRLLVAISSAAALGYLSWRCLLNARDAQSFGETTTLLQIPYGPFYLALAAGLAISAMLFIADAFREKGAS
jgi:TRAP-type C4-dicarboxylate transport system permease small subunit